MSLELLNKRLQYQGGNQQQRFIKDKEHGLKKSLLYYSYPYGLSTDSVPEEYPVLFVSQYLSPNLRQQQKKYIKIRQKGNSVS